MRVVRIAEVPETPNPSPIIVGGTVTVQPVVPTSKSNDFNCTVMNFAKGARNKFHSHTSDQVLVITDGVGIVATENEECEVTVGDIIHVPAGEKHWHGARKESYMSHITIMDKGSQTTTLED